MASDKVQTEVDRLNLRLDGKHRKGGQLSAFRLVMERLVEGGSVGQNDLQVFTRHDGARILAARPESIRTGQRWNAEWSRVARVLGATDLADLQVLYRLQDRAQKDPAGFTAAVPPRNAHRSFVSHAAAGAWYKPSFRAAGEVGPGPVEAECRLRLCRLTLLSASRPPRQRATSPRPPRPGPPRFMGRPTAGG